MSKDFKKALLLCYRYFQVNKISQFYDETYHSSGCKRSFKEGTYS